MDKTKVALLSTLLIATPVAGQATQDRMLELARQMAVSVMGLSPSGADIYAKRAATFSKFERYEALTRLDMLVGEELAREKPSRARLAELTEAIAREEASLARGQREELIKTAFQLSDRDRRAFGQHISRGNKEDLRKAKPVFSPLP